MNDQQRMLSDMADSLFVKLGPAATLNKDWLAISDVALTGLLVAEEAGGFGGSWNDALIIFRLAGYHALALPVVEATIAATLANRVEGRGTIGGGAQGTLEGDSFTGLITGLAWAEGADFAVVPAPGGGAMIVDLSGQTLESGTNIAGEPRGRLTAKALPVRRIDADLFAIGALARVAQIAGALDAALALSVSYVNERQQFGRPLAKFQAVQQTLAGFACEAAATNCAAMGAVQAMGREDAGFEIAAAKLRANRAIGHGTAAAHQVHGAIGFTEEYPLHPLTRRLWAWRSEFGNDSHWSAILGSMIIDRGADQFWATMTALTDQPSQMEK